MIVRSTARPSVMIFCGLHPTGGSGLLADAETVLSMGGHATPVATAVVVGDTTGTRDRSAISAVAVIGQARAVLEDVPVAAFKIGLVNTVEVAEAIHAILLDYPEIPVVLDPLSAAGEGGPPADDDLLETLVTLLLPRATVVTVNTVEARRLAPEADSPAAAAQQLMSYGCGAVLITGTRARSREVVNRLYASHRLLKTFSWERLPGRYQGAGCTLASAVATLLAHGLDAPSAVAEAQQFTWRALKHAYRLGHGRQIPNRLFWAARPEEAGA